MIICTEQKSDLNSRAKIEKKRVIRPSVALNIFFKYKNYNKLWLKTFHMMWTTSYRHHGTKKRVFVLLTISDWQRLWVDLYVFKHNSNTCRNNQNWLFLLLYCTRRTTSLSLHQIQSHLILHHQWICKCNELVDSRY